MFNNLILQAVLIVSIGACNILFGYGISEYERHRYEAKSQVFEKFYDDCRRELKNPD